MQETTTNPTEVRDNTGAEVDTNQENRLQEAGGGNDGKRRMVDNKDYINAIRLAASSYVLNFVLYDMKDRYNQKAKMLVNNAIKHSNKLIDLIERNFDTDAEDDTAVIAENYLLLLDEFLVAKDQNELFALIKAYNDGEVEIDSKTNP